MAEIEVNGGRVVYEFVGPEDGQVVVLTPGGRFSKDYPGVRPLAEALAAGGKRVLLWDRPNCGASDIQLFGRSESHMRAETLGLMLKELDTGPVVVTGGSGGARDSIIFTMMYPELATRLAVWSIVGGVYSTMSLASVYILSELRTVRSKGIEGIMEMPGLAGSWPDLIAANPRNKDRLLAIGAGEFERVMNRWLDAFVPKPNEPIPGVSDWEFEGIRVPTLIIRGGVGDFDHPKRTSMEVHCLINGSRLIEPPWPEDAWESSSAARDAGTGNIFDPWVQAAPVLLDFMNEPDEISAA
ncbi:pimeloyl-ACP methyl ester carboxylesterase [Kribbella sp. VKM Ac-2527]|uniref:Pimeloyl-ACP methyl ester carboxylesterase n=1 Tax=Kribbella caucasensis TaxID=2512215 RepID=A0A4R6KCB6_9ACTN|nr:alpha/beta hydrolase [Kribbella sp. VKM Ac-2527]TDO46400.1 pimeloyl-ACP methyl ester carboxylesterase [Kribbella sp. VKM Ac-2527]